MAFISKRNTGIIEEIGAGGRVIISAFFELAGPERILDPRQTPHGSRLKLPALIRHPAP